MLQKPDIFFFAAFGAFVLYIDCNMVILVKNIISIYCSVLWYLNEMSNDTCRVTEVSNDTCRVTEVSSDTCPMIGNVFYCAYMMFTALCFINFMYIQFVSHHFDALYFVYKVCVVLSVFSRFDNGFIMFPLFYLFSPSILQK